MGAEVYKRRGTLNGYPYVINIQTADRLYHICATQSSVHEDWLEKIRDHYVPNTEVRCFCNALWESAIKASSCKVGMNIHLMRNQVHRFSF